MNNISAILSSYGILHSPSARYHPQRAKPSLSGYNNIVFITGLHRFCAKYDNNIKKWQNNDLQTGDLYTYRSKMGIYV